MILHLTNINSENLKSDIILNKDLTNISYSNMYEILFDSESFDEIFNIVLQKLKEFTNQNFETYVKNMWGYIQNDDDFINFNMNFKDQVSIMPEYSFIYLVNSKNTDVCLKDENDVIEKVKLNEGEILIFKTKNFLNEVSQNKKRIALVGSLVSINENIGLMKKILI
jgi:hypothetical protein